jgi:hypothetical protein
MSPFSFMNVRLRERVIQILVGLALVLASGWYLWSDTIKPLVDKKITADSVGDSVKLGVHYLALQAHAEEMAKKREALLEEERKRRAEALKTDSALGKPVEP